MATIIKPNYTPLEGGYLRYVGHLGDDLAPLEAARMSTGNPTGVDESKDAGLRRRLWRKNHSTPFEMAVLQVEVQMPLFVAIEWLRHRTFSFNFYSHRYSEALDLYYKPTPERLAEGGQSTTNKQGAGEPIPLELVATVAESIGWEQSEHQKAYQSRLEGGLARELARINMPVSNFTRGRVQANLRNWFHFLKLRMDPAAQYEIRVYAEAAADMIRHIWPETFAVFEEYTLHGRNISRTERRIIERLIRQLGKVWDDHPAVLVKSEAIGELGETETRELLEKLYLTEA